MAERPLGLVDDAQDGSPDWDEVEQREGTPEMPIPAVPVHVDGPVQVHQLPPRMSTIGTLLLDAAGAGVQPVELLPKDLRRTTATILADVPIIIGTTKLATIAKGATSPATGGYWPANVPLTIRGSSQFWVSAVAAAAKVTVLAESWAD